ncbi:hypothetical protein GUITHDRAFT_119746 [Guillardia theta CCMP2712]|uniref:Uncharacterized protein n=2 Tax=Guillardia theta (strain CCMP2712) TaxID=905079 RepID=L1IDT8_GUITC|nr:hypothetical protein GUITHDRAFT_119744 [Guillardia theta CCMP2712]XP_005821056.1 hypothetical protein GUITHDRAFT_119746 [Guillardia theta CCMP2712]EKX34074.1 hypothetical protein GUITHDRAFT_119744 [Guillardia theta CCMP2712]EKX34076.1 hypothetical protein GUITHDRAFT_119746 [Guillardia theta CCMP2712]|eukprot:XP_005821054.1 hypothetical protein GUITHDRAFT_119744 [Guillardia theta CCMP2712]
MCVMDKHMRSLQGASCRIKSLAGRLILSSVRGCYTMVSSGMRNGEARAIEDVEETRYHLYFSMMLSINNDNSCYDTNSSILVSELSAMLAPIVPQDLIPPIVACAAVLVGCLASEYMQEEAPIVVMRRRCRSTGLSMLNDLQLDGLNAVFPALVLCYYIYRSASEDRGWWYHLLDLDMDDEQLASIRDEAADYLADRVLADVIQDKGAFLACPALVLTGEEELRMHLYRRKVLVPKYMRLFSWASAEYQDMMRQMLDLIAERGFREAVQNGCQCPWRELFRRAEFLGLWEAEGVGLSTGVLADMLQLLPDDDVPFSAMFSLILRDAVGDLRPSLRRTSLHVDVFLSFLDFIRLCNHTSVSYENFAARVKLCVRPRLDYAPHLLADMSNSGLTILTRRRRKAMHKVSRELMLGYAMLASTISDNYSRILPRDRWLVGGEEQVKAVRRQASEHIVKLLGRVGV